jgi:hypothetical protein
VLLKVFPEKSVVEFTNEKAHPFTFAEPEASFVTSKNPPLIRAPKSTPERLNFQILPVAMGLLVEKFPLEAGEEKFS